MVEQATFVTARTVAPGMQACRNTSEQATLEADPKKAQADGRNEIVDAAARLRPDCVVVVQLDARGRAA